MSTNFPSDTDTLIETAKRSLTPVEVDPSKLYAVYSPSQGGTVLFDPERVLSAPRRRQGTVLLRDAASFGHYVNVQSPGKAGLLYADREALKMVAVLNDSIAGAPGWRDHRAVLEVRRTPEWTFWANADGKLLSQVAFAEHIEQGQPEIVNPDAATVLELAQTFEAEQKVAFKSATTLQDGSKQFKYEQTTDARAGVGQITIPKQFELGVAPFEGAEPYKLTARLRYRIESEQLRIGYQLVRPQDVLFAAFDEITRAVESVTALTALRGQPEAQRS